VNKLLNKYYAVFLTELSYCHCRRGVEEKRLVNQIVSDCKRKRKGKNRQEIIELGLDIFDKQNVKAQSVLDELLSLNYVVRKNINNIPKIFITEDGRIFLERYLTRDYSEEYQKYAQALNALLKEHDKPPMRSLYSMIDFHTGISVSEATKHLLEWDEIDQD